MFFILLMRFVYKLNLLNHVDNHVVNHVDKHLDNHVQMIYCVTNTQCTSDNCTIIDWICVQLRPVSLYLKWQVI